MSHNAAVATFVLIPGAGGAGTVYWSELAKILRRGGHTAVSVEIPGDDPALGLPEYAAIVDDAIGKHRDVVVVAQSMGGFTVPMLTKRPQIGRIVFVNAMIPIPGETPSQWFEATGAEAARETANAAAGRPDEFDPDTVFLHDIPPEVRAEMAAGDREPAATAFAQQCAFDSWPIVPTLVLAGADDRLFPVQFQVRVARERLGIAAAIIPGGHLVAKSQPAELARRLLIFSMQQEVPFDLAAASAELRRVALAVRDDQLDLPTPCEDWTVRDLLVHVGHAARAFAEAARHDAVEEATPDGADLPAGWRERLGHDLGVLVTAWLDPAAWRGAAEATGVTMPSPEVARVALTELVVHTWDLAVATDQGFRVDRRDLEVCYDYAKAMAAPQMLASRRDLYGDVVTLPAGSTTLDRLLALTGRRPAEWTNSASRQERSHRR